MSEIIVDNNQQQNTIEMITDHQEETIVEQCDEHQENHYDNDNNNQQTNDDVIENFDDINLEFDCPESIDFKDPNVEDQARKHENQENITQRRRPQIIRNSTTTKLYSKTVEKVNLSPISKKKKQLKPVTYINKRPIINVNERLYNAALRRQPIYKTLAELVQDFDKKTRVYEDEVVKKHNSNNLKKNLIHPKSPKLLSKNRNRARTALSQLEQDELIARTIKKNTFKAQPFNKKIFDNYATGVPKVQCQKKMPTNNLEFGFHSTRNLEKRKEKIQTIQQSIENEANFVFKARPMPIFRKVPIMMRNNQMMIKKQTSDICLNRNVNKTINTIIKQTSDSTLTRIAHHDLSIHSDMENKTEEQMLNNATDEKDNSIAKSINEKLSTETEDESSVCEFKSLTNFENSKEYEDVLLTTEADSNEDKN